MAHSRPPGLGNKGDAWRITTIAGAFVIELCTDRRVQALGVQWRQAREQGGQLLTAALAAAQSQTYVDQAAADAAYAALEKTFIADYNANEQAATERFVRDELQLESDQPDCANLPGCAWWVAACLLDCFRLALRNEQHPDDQRQFSIDVLMPNMATRGKKPAHGGEDMKRGARWFYRTKVKERRDSIHEIAKEYMSWAGRDPGPDNDGRSVVQNSLDQVEHYLNLMTKRAVRLT